MHSIPTNTHRTRLPNKKRPNISHTSSHTRNAFHMQMGTRRVWIYGFVLCARRNIHSVHEDVRKCRPYMFMYVRAYEVNDMPLPIIVHHHHHQHRLNDRTPNEQTVDAPSNANHRQINVCLWWWRRWLHVSSDGRKRCTKNGTWILLPKKHVETLETRHYCFWFVSLI